MADKRDAIIALALAQQIKPILAGAGAPIQGFVLAELLATWLAGHTDDDPDKARRLRAGLLLSLLTAVRQLVALADG